jgi:hypothetical protein
MDVVEVGAQLGCLLSMMATSTKTLGLITTWSLFGIGHLYLSGVWTPIEE